MTELNRQSSNSSATTKVSSNASLTSSTSYDPPEVEQDRSTSSDHNVDIAGIDKTFEQLDLENNDESTPVPPAPHPKPRHDSAANSALEVGGADVEAVSSSSHDDSTRMDGGSVDDDHDQWHEYTKAMYNYTVSCSFAKKQVDCSAHLNFPSVGMHIRLAETICTSPKTIRKALEGAG